MHPNDSAWQRPQQPNPQQPNSWQPPPSGPWPPPRGGQPYPPAGHGYLPAPPPPRNTNRTAWILGGVIATILAMVIVVVAVVAFNGDSTTSTSPGSSSSDEDQIRQVTAEITQASNAADAERVNALTCKRIRETHPATPESLKRSLDAYGTYTVHVETIDITGDHAAVQMTLKGSKESGPPGTGVFQYLREDGSWKHCTD